MTGTQVPRFRPTQQQILEYAGGKVGVSAVPGSGKTFTLSHLAARLVGRLADADLADEQEVLVVTFANSAVNTIKARIASILHSERVILPYIGYRVRTLHGLAHDIVRERPALVGLVEDFQIVDERVATAIRRDVVETWVRTYGQQLLDAYADPEQAGTEQGAHRIRHDELPNMAQRIAETFIRQAKDRRLSHVATRELLDSAGMDLPLVRFGVEVYEAYQRSLSYRGAVDFDDLVRLALAALDSDPEYLARLQARWPFVLEDEAQDSSLLQEELLRRLSAGRNWVRVGDPNQAINTTFTTAHPKYLRAFLNEPGVTPFTLDEAGRSAEPVIALANALIRWSAEHPVPALRQTFLAQDIRAVPTDDGQPNPPDDEALVYIHFKPGEKITPDRELEIVVESLANWLPNNPHRTVAVLVPENAHGFKLAELLRARDLPFEELLRSTTSTREAAQRLRAILDFIASAIAPSSGEKLARLYAEQWWPRHLGTTDDPERSRAWLEATNTALAGCRQMEAFLWPDIDQSPLDVLDLPPDLPDLAELAADIEAFRTQVMRWLRAAVLPIDQLVLTISQDVFSQPNDIALGYKLAQLLRAFALNNPEARLPAFVEELRVISQNQRRFLGFDDVEAGYEPKPGRITVATNHAAKGLEWDRVYLLSVNNYSYPSAQAFDRYQGEARFIRGRMNLELEALAQLDMLASGAAYEEGAATAQYRLDFAAERLRLLYVGITRARRELLILWNTGRFSNRGPSFEQQPALPLVPLWEFIQRRREGNL